MCHNSKTNELTRTDEPMITYKVVETVQEYNGKKRPKTIKDHVRTLHRLKQYKLNETYEVSLTEIEVNINLNAVSANRPYEHCVEFNNGFHSYLSKRDAALGMYKHAEPYRRARIVRCEIPAGSFVSFGTENGKLPSVLSNKITVTKVVSGGRIVRRRLYQSFSDLFN